LRSNALSRALPGLLAALVLAGGARGQQELSARALARETSDPTSDLWYLFSEFAVSATPRESFARSNRFTLEFQPSMPVPLTCSWRLLNYPDLTFASEGSASGRRETGIESFTWMSALSPVTGRLGWAYGAGPFVSFPVATSAAFEPNPWRFGMGGVLAWRSEANLVSMLANVGWATESREAGSLEIQYNVQHFLSNGVQVGLGRPRVEYQWDHGGRGAWDIPVGLDIAKVFHVGRLPVKVMLEYDFYVVNDNRWEPEHLFRVTILPVFPGPFGRPLFD
jgi:hypothetical protein